MKIEIDFEKKEITLKDDIPLGELVKRLKEIKIEDWKEWKVKSGEKEYIYYPIYQWWYAPYPIYPTYPTFPIYQPPYRITWDTTAAIGTYDESTHSFVTTN